jgi:D-alanyl-D-alanine carboxypeptidase
VYLRRFRPVLFALVLGAGSFMGAVQATPVAAATDLPACRYDDVLTDPAGYDDWSITLLDSTYALRKDYVPPGLVSTSNAGLNAGGKVRKLAIADLTALAQAARGANAGVRVVSAYRSYTTQNRLYQREVDRYGERAGRLSVARPGHSEHQLGVTIDFGSSNSDKSAWQYDDWAQTKAGAWMKSNAWKFGWLMSYPKNKRGVTCYRYEPWHYRYVGVELAAKVHDSGLTLREYIWAHRQEPPPPPA